MAEQSYESHTHNPIPTTIVGLFALIALVLMIGYMFFGWQTRDWALLAVIAAVFVLGGISRLYTTSLQDRIIMLEMKVRCAEVLPAGQEANLAKLSKRQIIALRFASDEELGALLERAARENLSPKDIKASIKTWRPDLHRT
jgi:uncharacterized SAM-binding protein YcdF (DUF218 family)